MSVKYRLVQFWPRKGRQNYPDCRYQGWIHILPHNKKSVGPIKAPVTKTTKFTTQVNQIFGSSYKTLCVKKEPYYPDFLEQSPLSHQSIALKTRKYVSNFFRVCLRESRGHMDAIYDNFRCKGTTPSPPAQALGVHIHTCSTKVLTNSCG